MSLMLDCRPQSGYSVILQKDELLLLHILEEGDGGGVHGVHEKTRKRTSTQKILCSFFVVVV